MEQRGRGAGCTAEESAGEPAAQTPRAEKPSLLVVGRAAAGEGPGAVCVAVLEPEVSADLAPARAHP